MSNRVERIVNSYEAKLRLGAVGRLTEEEITSRVANYSMAAYREDGKLQQVRQVLCSHGVDTIWYVYYHAFSRELGKLHRKDISGVTMQLEYAFIVSKWEARGLRREVLLSVGSTVFNMYLLPV